jgi:HlyD family secretion protein
MRSNGIFGLALLLVAGCSQGDRTPPPDPAPTMSVAMVSRQAIPGGLTASGRLISREEAAVSPDVAGYRVRRVLVEEDAEVAKGQVLAELDSALLGAQVAQSQASLAQQEVAADKAGAEAQRVVGLDAKGVLSDEAIAERRLAARSATASVGVAKAQLDELLTQQARLLIRAPVAGRVLTRQVRPGDIAALGTVMFTIARDNLVELAAELPEAAVANVHVGDAVTVRLPTGVAVEGHVRLIGAHVDTSTGLVSTRIELPVRDDLRPGGFATARFGTMSSPAIVVPEQAIRFDSNGASVLVVDATDRVHQMTVHTGRRAGGLVEIMQGPPVGARVVLSGGSLLLDGDAIRPVLRHAGA